MATQITLRKSKYRGHESKKETTKEVQERYDDLVGILNDAIQEERLDTNRLSQLASDAKAARKKDKDEEAPAAPGEKGEKGRGKDGKGKGKGKDKGQKGEGKDSKGKGKGYCEIIDVSSLKVGADGKRLCVFFQTGECQDDDCKYLHEECTTDEQKTAAQKLREVITRARAQSKPPAAPSTYDDDQWWWTPSWPGRRRRGRSSSRGPAGQ